MLKLSDHVTKINGVGERYAKFLKKLEITTVQDLLFHAPFRYEDYTETTKINNLQPNQTYTIIGSVDVINNIFTKNGKRLTKAQVSDDTGKIEVVWFNQHYLIKSIKVGQKYTFSGKTNLFNSKLSLVSPVWEKSGEESLNTGRLVPVYNETAGLSSKWLRARINDVLLQLNQSNQIKNEMPADILQKNELLALNEAINNIHFPSTFADATHAKQTLAFNELFFELLKVENRKTQWHQTFEGVFINNSNFEDEQKKLKKSLPFTLTTSQERVIKEVFSDLQTKNPMNRLLEGDVGSGKTMVALFAAYITHLAGYKTLYMAPTEILAKQHFKTFNEFLGPFIGKENIKLKTSSHKDSVADDFNDIVIGTHALLFADEPIKNVGIIVIDEQHRFGVEQRAQIAQIGDNNLKPNVLTMTATPIPRTLALTLYGDLDISILDTVPNKNKKITTKVVPEKQRLEIFEWIKNHNEQAFVVCPFIEQSTNEQFENVKAAEEEFKKLTDVKNGVFKELSVGLLHGRMNAKQKSEVMKDFKDKKYQILVSTPVIEVGVDVPEAAVMVIESAERYGLASLHQLRGRVGRGSKQGHCFLFMSGFSKPSYERLKHLENETSGFKLAEIDMQYRGQGDLYGTAQSGFKTFKFADLSDLKLVESVKKEVLHVYENKNVYSDLFLKLADESHRVAHN